MNDSLFVFYRFINICLLLWLQLLGLGQVNLVPNPGFDEWDNCPMNDGNVGGFTKDWYIAKDSPDYYNACNTSIFGTPYNGSGYQIPRSGTAYMGAAMYSAFNTIFVPMEMFQVKLKQKLVGGKKYCVTFYVTPSNESGYFTNCLEVFFSATTEFYPNVIVDGSVIPQINTSGNIIGDTAAWTEINGSFIANGGEEYMTLGCFNTIYHIDTIKNTPASPTSTWESNAYYYFDDVSVVFCDESTVQDIVVPNIFTPNGDGVNDILYIVEPNNYNSDVNLIIYNRWGNVVHKTDNVFGLFWDGTSSLGQPVSAGVYYYIISDEKDTKSGFIQVNY